MLLQGIAVPPFGVPMTTADARMMLKHLTSCFGVKPQALLLPRQSGCGRVRLCELGSLQALVDLMVEDVGHDISRHTEVVAAYHSHMGSHLRESLTDLPLLSMLALQPRPSSLITSSPAQLPT